MAIKKSITLICSDVGDNANKVWIGELYDDDSVITKWGRVGYDMQSKTFPLAGEVFLNKKQKEKLNKGYMVPRIVGGTGGTGPTQNIQQSSLAAIALNQLAKSHPELTKLVDRLVKANIHNITSNTNIKYNSGTGLFQTPLGIITLDGIVEARELLVEIKKGIKKPEFLSGVISKYLMIIPQDVGMKIDVKKLFPDDAAIQKQADILDSLESSYKSITANPISKDDKSPDPEKIFDVDLDVLNDDRERDRLIKYYESTKKRAHGYDHIKVKEIYKVAVHEMSRTFESKGKNLGSITEVYHGTSQANLLSILKSGLKVSPPSTAFIAGKMFGNGIYGAIHSSKSLGYTFGKWGGLTADSGWLFVCSFAMGKVYTPVGRCSKPLTGYNSVWAEPSKCALLHDELIVYDNSQVKINYLLEVK